jgi:hypothetical protein
MEILEITTFPRYVFFVSVVYFGSCCSFLFLFSCLFTVGLRFLYVCFHFSPYFPWSLGYAQLSPWAQGRAEVFTKMLADHPQV